MMAMRCPYCGHQNAMGTMFCARCGQPTAGQFCLECSTHCPLQATVCPRCRQPLPLPLQRLLGVGCILANRYRIERLLGCGGFGAVYLAADLHFRQRQVAVKENHDPTVLNSFLKEAELLATINHPNLPRVSDFFTDHPPTIPTPRPYMVMDYIAGEELWDRIQQKGRLSEAEVLTLLCGVFDALEYLHHLNPPVIHRDIKPQNIRITPDRRTFLVDFGVAKWGAGMTTVGAQAVTPGFAPPEQYRKAGQTDERSDQYALAATIYCAPTGQLPPEATVREQALVSGKPDPLPSVEQFAPEVSVRVRRALRRALSVEKSDRFPSIIEFRRALYPPTFVGMTRRQWLSAAALTVTCLTAGALLGYEVWRQRQPLWLVAELEGHSAGVTGVLFTPDGKGLVSASHDRTIRIWDWEQPALRQTLTGHEGSVRSLALWNVTQIVSGSWDGTVRAWSWHSGHQLVLWEAGIGRLHAVIADPDGQWLVAGGDEGLWLLFADGPNVRRYSLPPVCSLAFHPQRAFIAVGDAHGMIWLWEPTQHRPSASWRAHQGAVTALAFHPDGRWLLSGGEDAELVVWDTTTRQPTRRLRGWHQREIRAVAFRPDGRFAVSSSMDDRLRIWRVSDWQPAVVWEGGRNWALALAFHPSGRWLASASKDERVKVWRLRL